MLRSLILTSLGLWLAATAPGWLAGEPVATERDEANARTADADLPPSSGAPDDGTERGPRSSPVVLAETPKAERVVRSAELSRPATGLSRPQPLASRPSPARRLQNTLRLDRSHATLLPQCAPAIRPHAPPG